MTDGEDSLDSRPTASPGGEAPAPRLGDSAERRHFILGLLTILVVILIVVEAVRLLR